jgi:hypothetical protein
MVGDILIEYKMRRVSMYFFSAGSSMSPSYVILEDHIILCHIVNWYLKFNKWPCASLWCRGRASVRGAELETSSIGFTRFKLGGSRLGVQLYVQSRIQLISLGLAESPANIVLL